VKNKWSLVLSVSCCPAQQSSPVAPATRTNEQDRPAPPTVLLHHPRALSQLDKGFGPQGYFGVVRGASDEEVVRGGDQLIAVSIDLHDFEVVIQVPGGRAVLKL
jgi:hypothetical protein